MKLLPRFPWRGGPRPRTMDMVLDHDGRHWIATGGGLRLQAATLEELDRKVEAALSGEFSPGRPLEVFMASNNEMIPKWMRPYMNHYFNRILELPPRREQRVRPQDSRGFQHVLDKGGT